MKKITIYMLSLTFFVLGVTSCAKSTKRKVTNEWKITSYVKIDHITNGGGSDESTFNMTETSYTNDNSSTTNGSTVSYHSEGAVNAHTISIKKDGTWTWTQDCTYNGNNNSSSRTIIEQTGTWSFVGKTKGDDFKKNERLLFNILTEKNISTQTSNQVVVSENTSNYTYLTGENIQIYTIKESKNKKMELEFIKDMRNGINTTETSINMILEEK
jgi:hypothetical protein